MNIFLQRLRRMAHSVQSARGTAQPHRNALRAAGTIAAITLIALATGCTSRQSAPVIDRTAGAATSGIPATPAATPAAAGGPDFYTVKRGDTMYGIALDHGQDYREMAAWNNITNPGVIQVGQVLRVTPPPGTPGVAESGVVVRAIVVPGSAPATAGVPGIITEPRGDKRPYSDEALAQAQQTQQTQAAQAKPGAAVAANHTATPKPADKPAEKPAENPAVVSDDVAWSWPAGGKMIGAFSESSTNKGIDIAAKVGDPVLAAGPGKVVYSGQGLRGYGRLVIIKHNNTWLSAYAHNSNLLVKEGQTVGRGQKIAEAGSTDSDVPKLHFEIRRQGKPVDPVKLLPER